jgi:hypothetical protein
MDIRPLGKPSVMANTNDPREFYRLSKIVLMPSRQNGHQLLRHYYFATRIDRPDDHGVSPGQRMVFLLTLQSVK